MRHSGQESIAVFLPVNTQQPKAISLLVSFYREFWKSRRNHSRDLLIIIGYKIPSLVQIAREFGCVIQQALKISVTNSHDNFSVVLNPGIFYCNW